MAATLSFAKTSPKVRRFSYPENAILCSPPHFACREWLKLFISHQQNKVAVLYTSLPQQCNQPAHSTTPPMLWTTTPMSCLQLEGSRLGEGCSAHWPGSMSHWTQWDMIWFIRFVYCFILLPLENSLSVSPSLYSCNDLCTNKYVLHMREHFLSSALRVASATCSSVLRKSKLLLSSPFLHQLWFCKPCKHSIKTSAEKLKDVSLPLSGCCHDYL